MSSRLKLAIALLALAIPLIACTFTIHFARDGWTTSLDWTGALEPATRPAASQP
jgi:hypothetical protein